MQVHVVLTPGIVFPSLFCLAVGGASLYGSWWVGWIAGYTAETWIYIVAALVVAFGTGTIAAVAVSWGKRSSRVAAIYPWWSVLMIVPVAGLCGINGYRTAELAMTLLAGIVLYLNGRAMRALHTRKDKQLSENDFR